MKKQKTPSFIVIATLTVITIVSWVVYGVYQAFVTIPPLDVPAEVAAPIDPSLDTQSLDKLEKSIFFEEGEITKSIIVISTPTPTPTSVPSSEETPTPTPEVSPEEQPTLTPTIIETTEGQQ